ncbi:adenylosuccinate lyase [Ekhidna sp.]|uniref:adenylosuccinate lyase n=1 Tax=Ekhidna sp. TaxID=2608089 RepID=UPI003CCBA765
MNFNPLEGISPIDGRYRSKVSLLSDYFSEKALIQYRVKVEVLYFIALYESGIPQLAAYNADKNEALKKIYETFSLEDAEAIKEIEKTTNHDVKAVEYFLKEKFDELGLSDFKEFIHFGLTSQDINNTSIPLSLKEALNEVFVPKLLSLVSSLESKSDEWSEIPMLAKTHGQPASPTRLGKEINVFAVRLKEQLDLLNQVPFAAKFGGATGNFNAHTVAYPNYDWHAFGDQFVKEKLGLKRSHPTTQIEHYDHLAALFDALKRINTILIDFSRDVWQYISMNYFTQTIAKNEVGSSAMPHKVNPIDFENAEGNLGMANAIFEHLSAKLPISRLQRDLTDSTVLRNIGTPIAHSFIAILSLEKGLSKIHANEKAIRADLEENWAVVAEAIQTILRREGYPKPYEALKALTRTNEAITQESISVFIDGLNVSEEVKAELKVITPYNYTGK